MLQIWSMKQDTCLHDFKEHTKVLGLILMPPNILNHTTPFFHLIIHINNLLKVLQLWIISSIHIILFFFQNNHYPLVLLSTCKSYYSKNSIAKIGYILICTLLLVVCQHMVDSLLKRPCIYYPTTSCFISHIEQFGNDFCNCHMQIRSFIIFLILLTSSINF